MSIEKVTSGSVAKNNKLNEVIAAINSLTGMTVRQGSSSESPKFVYGERKSELITTGGGGAGGDFVETNFIMCVNGSPVSGKILFKAD